MRLAQLVLVSLLAIVGCHGPAAQAKESSMQDADALFKAGQYEAALHKYEATIAKPADDAGYARALMRALSCEVSLGRYEQALDRARAARPPGDVRLRALFDVTRLDLFAAVGHRYGYSDETEEHAEGSAKLSKAQVRRQVEPILQALWRDRQALARSPLGDWRDYVTLDDVDFQIFPSLWDFAVQEMVTVLENQSLVAPDAGPRLDPRLFTGEDMPRAFDAGRAPRLRQAALYEESAHLDGGSVARAAAGEYWRVARVGLGQAAVNGAADHRFDESAAARWSGWAQSMRTPLGRAAAALAAAQLWQHSRRVDALRLIDGALPKAPSGDVAFRLRATRAEILQPELAFVTYTTRDGKRALHLNTRNLPKVYLRLYHVDPKSDVQGEFWSTELNFPNATRVQKWMMLAKPVAAWEWATGDAGDHAPVVRDLDLRAPGLGLYGIVISADAAFDQGKSLIRTGFVNITDLAIARSQSDEGARFYAFDAAGQPLADLPFALLHAKDWRTKSSSEVKTDHDGLARWAWPRGPYLQLDALAIHGPAVAKFQGPLYHGERPTPPPLALFLATDRPIYRPGQTLHARVTSVARAGADYKVDAGRKLRLLLHDANGTEVARRDVVTDAMGSAAITLTLPDKGLLGRFTLVAQSPQYDRVQQALTVTVEEYKRPEFEVTLDAPKQAARYGETTHVGGKVQYYFGGAAGDVPVRFKVFRQRWIPWWYWRRPMGGRTEIARGETKTGKDGSFTVDFVAARDPEEAESQDPETPDVSDFIVEVEAHDAGGRTIPAERQVRVGARSLLVHAEGEHGFFLSDEPARVKLKVTNLAEEAQAVDAEWHLEQLGAPPAAPPADQAGDERPLTERLKPYPAARELAHGTTRTGTGEPTALALGALPAGGYRLRVRAGDATTSYTFLVADAHTRSVPLSLPPMMVARQSEAQPGGRLDLLIGASVGSGAYHVELWRGGQLVDHKLERGAPVRVWTIHVDERLAGGFTARWIGGSRFDAAGAGRGLDIIGGDAAVAVPRKDKALTVKLIDKTPALEPGQKARWTVQVTDGLGHPVAGQALVTVYDRSLELYAQDRGPWADTLWTAPPSPNPREEGERQHDAINFSEDARFRAEQEKLEQSHHASQPPHFGWVPRWAVYSMAAAPGGFGGGRGGVTLSAPVAFEGADIRMAEGPMPPPAPAPRAAGNVAKTTSGLTYSRIGSPAAPALGPALRTNMAETALFVPDLRIDSQGHGRFEISAPERLSSWRIELLALGERVQAGRGSDTFVTRKPFMVRVELPRFVREDDHTVITAMVHNETDSALQADVDLAIADDASGKSALDALGIKEPRRHVTVPAHGLTPVTYALVAPENVATYKVRVHATAGKLSDAEERPLPLLPSRERLVQSRVVALQGDAKRKLVFNELVHSQDPSLRSESLTVSIDPELALAVLRSIPSLVEYPYECVEQTLNRYVPLAIVNQIYRQHPELAKAIAAAPHRETQHEPWNQPDERRLLALTETPWLADSAGGLRDERLRSLLDPKLVATMGEAALAKLKQAQLPSGAFPWFPGGRDNGYMTLYVLEQLAMLQEFGLSPPRDLVERALGAVTHLVSIDTKPGEADVALAAYAAYVVTTFDPKTFPAAAALRPSAQKWMTAVLAQKEQLTPFGRAWCARAMARLGDRKTAMTLLESALDGAKTDPVIGVYWAPERYAWHWYADTIEKHAFFLRTLSELKPDDPRVPGMLQWLLFNRKGNQWHSTKASAAAVYSILDLMQKQGALSQPQKFHVVWDKQEELVTVKPTEDRRTPLSWTVRGRDVTPARGTIDVGKEGPGVAFASATWIFSSTKLQAAHASDLLGVERRYFRKVHQADGDHLVPLAAGDQVHVGDEIEVRLTVRSKSAFEFVHVKEPRGAGFEETTLTSGYRWNPVPAYQEPRDSLFNFFVDWLPAGEIELRHSIRPTTPGRYRIGSAVVQSMYSPDMTAYSSGLELEVVK